MKSKHYEYLKPPTESCLCCNKKINTLKISNLETKASPASKPKVVKPKGNKKSKSNNNNNNNNGTNNNNSNNTNNDSGNLQLKQLMDIFKVQTWVEEIKDDDNDSPMDGKNIRLKEETLVKCG